MRLIKGKSNNKSEVEIIWNLIHTLNEKNKIYCLELIMAIEADERNCFLNPYMKAVNKLHNSRPQGAELREAV